MVILVLTVIYSYIPTAAIKTLQKEKSIEKGTEISGMSYRTVLSVGGCSHEMLEAG
jgi:hypothetical protein